MQLGGRRWEGGERSELGLSLPLVWGAHVGGTPEHTRDGLGRSWVQVCVLLGASIATLAMVCWHGAQAEGMPLFLGGCDVQGWGELGCLSAVGGAHCAVSQWCVFGEELWLS